MKTVSKTKRGCAYWLRLLAVGLAGGLIMFLAGYVILGIHFGTHPGRSPVCCVTPADGGFEYETLTLSGAGGTPLAAWYVPARNGAAVIMLHGYGGSRVELLSRAVMLARAGYGVLLYDQRAQGESGGELGSSGWQDVDDVPAAVAFLQGRPEVDAERIGLFGFSVGGQVALVAAAGDPAIRAVAVDGPSIAIVEDLPPMKGLRERVLWASQWLIDRGVAWRTGVRRPAGVVPALPAIAPRPLLIVATGQDEIELRIASHYYALAGEPKTLWAIPEAGHGGGPAARPEEYERRLVEFFDRALRESP